MIRRFILFVRAGMGKYFGGGLHHWVMKLSKDWIFVSVSH